MKPVHGYIKAALVYSILPDRIRTRVQNRLGEKHLDRLNSNLSHVKSLGSQQQAKILEEFTSRMKEMQEARERKISRGLVASGTVLALLVLGSFLVSLAKGRGTDEIIKFMELLLANGGMHLVFFPYILEFINAHYRISPVRLFLPSANILIDLVMAAFLAPLVALMFMLLLPPHSVSATGAAGITGFSIFYGIMAFTVGPATEELFFRYLMFLRPGEQYGFVFMGIVSSLLFASVHMPESFTSFAIYTATGGLFCAIAGYRRRLFAPFITHALANGLLFFFS